MRSFQVSKWEFGKVEMSTQAELLVERNGKRESGNAEL